MGFLFLHRHIKTVPRGLILLLEDRVGVEVDADDIGWWIVQIEITGVDAYNEGHWGVQHISQHQRAQRDVRALPVQWEDHLQHRRKGWWAGGRGWECWGALLEDRDALIEAGRLETQLGSPAGHSQTPGPRTRW